MAELAARFLEEYVPAHCKPGTRTVYRSALVNHVIPRLGTRRVADIERADIVALHHALRATPYQANRTVQVLSRLFTLAEVWGLRPDGSNPCRHVWRFREEKRERFLSDAEYARLGAALKEGEEQGLDTVFWDRTLTGFGVRVYPTGGKVFVAQARCPNGPGRPNRPRRITVGRHPMLSATEARQRAALLIARVKAGEDPVPVPLPLPAKHSGGPTIADLGRRYLEEHVANRCKPKTQRTARSVVNRHIVPALRTLPIAAVERRHVMALHESLCEIPAMANLVVETLTYMYKLAKGWDMVPEDHDDPCQSIPMNPKKKQERFLTDAEFTRIGQVLDEVSGNGSQVSAGAITTIRLLMLTGCRKTEIMPPPWEHVDLDRAEIRIVNGKTGNRTVHLSPAAVSGLATLPREPDNPWVVPGAKPGKHMADIDGAWQSIRAKAGLEDVRIHDIRHSFASRALALGEGLPIIGRLLGHRRIETTARYAHLARDSVRESAERVAVSIAEDILYP